MQLHVDALRPTCTLPGRARSTARDEVRRLLGSYATGRDPSARERLVELNTELVQFIARRFADRGEPLEDIVQVGFLGLIQAIERFDPDRENEFSSFATPTIMGEIRRHFRDRSWAVRVPRRLQENYCRAMRGEEQLSQELGRRPSVAEIATHLHLAPDEVLAALEVSPARRAISLDARSRGRGDDGDGMELGDRLGREDGNLEQVEARALVEQAMAHLSPREREIMSLRFFEQLPQTEVAKRVGISQMHVSRLQRVALEHMRRDLATVTRRRCPTVAAPSAGSRDAPHGVGDVPPHGAVRASHPVLCWLPVAALSPRADQPRQTIPPDTLAELADSIRQWGILQPLRVREGGEHGYEIIAGERRWSAARRLGMRDVPALVVTTNQEGAFIESLTENIQREDLNPVERARALQRLRVSLGSQTWEDVGRVVGITRRHVHHLLNVTRLPAEMQGDVRVGDLNEKHARALLLLRTSPAGQRRLWQRIHADRLSGEAALEVARALRDTTRELPHSVLRARAAIRSLSMFVSTAAQPEMATLAVDLRALQTQLREASAAIGRRLESQTAESDPPADQEHRRERTNAGSPGPGRRAPRSRDSSKPPRSRESSSTAMPSSSRGGSMPAASSR
jgi:RNA polymerase sigma-B factor